MIFYFRLARELGMTVGNMLQQITSAEIIGWMAFLAVEDEQRSAAQRKENFKKLKKLF